MLRTPRRSGRARLQTGSGPATSASPTRRAPATRDNANPVIAAPATTDPKSLAHEPRFRRRPLRPILRPPAMEWGASTSTKIHVERKSGQARRLRKAGCAAARAPAGLDPDTSPQSASSAYNAYAEMLEQRSKMIAVLPPRVAQLWSTSGQVWPLSSKLLPMFANFGQIWSIPRHFCRFCLRRRPGKSRAGGSRGMRLCWPASLGADAV